MRAHGGGCPVLRRQGPSPGAVLAVVGDAGAAPTRARGFGHFLRPPRPRERLLPGPGAALERWRTWMTALTCHQPRSSDQRRPNPDIPAGYTYLLQLVAHDMVDSEGLPEAAADTITDAFDIRSRRLVLQTLYGEADAVPASAPYMQLGPARGRDRAIPGRDLPRDLVNRRPLIEDVRNDYHSNMSQLATLFLQFHNAVAAMLPPTLAPECAFRLAQHATILIYREVVRRDLMPRILHPDIAALYADGRPILTPDPPAELSLEFCVGAFRFGHVMVRDWYELVSPVTPFSQVLRQTMRALPAPQATMPLAAGWLARWSRFFPMPGMPAPMESMCFVPTPPLYSAGGMFEPLLGDPPQRHGLLYRDLNTALLFGLWSPFALREAIVDRDRRFAVLPQAQTVSDEIARWLGEDGFMNSSAAAREAIATDPPLPFYVLFEAWWEGGGDGRRLGPLGSTIVAETLFGALDRWRPAYERDTLTASLTALHPALAPLGDCTGMPTIVARVAAANRWDATVPAFL